MYETILLSLALAVSAAALALAREVRLRRALERLCRFLLVQLCGSKPNSRADQSGHDPDPPLDDPRLQ
jgi:hypothetical protein